MKLLKQILCLIHQALEWCHRLYGCPPYCIAVAPHLIAVFKVAKIS